MKMIILSAVVAAGTMLTGTDKAEAGRIHAGFGVGIGAPPVVIQPYPPVYHPGWYGPGYHPRLYGRAYRPMVRPHRPVYVQPAPMIRHRGPRYRW